MLRGLAVLFVFWLILLWMYRRKKLSSVYHHRRTRSPEKLLPSE